MSKHNCNDCRELDMTAYTLTRGLSRILEKVGPIRLPKAHTIPQGQMGALQCKEDGDDEIWSFEQLPDVTSTGRES